MLRHPHRSHRMELLQDTLAEQIPTIPNHRQALVSLLLQGRSKQTPLGLGCLQQQRGMLTEQQQSSGSLEVDPAPGKLLLI